MKGYSRSSRFSQSTYLYWQKCFDRGNTDQKLEDKILEICKNNKVMAIGVCGEN